jgi:hypothetical protein
MIFLLAPRKATLALATLNSPERQPKRNGQEAEPRQIQALAQAPFPQLFWALIFGELFGSVSMFVRIS